MKLNRRRRSNWVNCIESLESRTLLSRTLGIDVSSYQGDITKAEWTTYKNSDSIAFAWTKGTEGIGSEDPTFTNNMSTAVQAGMPIGAYNFAHYDTHMGTSGAQAEADNFWSYLSPYYTSANFAKKEYLMPMLDLEAVVYGGVSYGPDHYGYTQATLSQWVNAWANEMVTDAAATGVVIQPVIYTGAAFAQQWLNTSVAQSWANWIADYNGESAQTGSPLYKSSYGPWSTWQIWQYNDTGSAPGDQDVINGDSTDLQNFIFGSGKFAKNSTVQTTASVTATQNYNGSGTSHAVAAGTGGTVLGSPEYYNNAWFFDVSFSTGVGGWVKETSLVAVTSAPAAPTNNSPANNAFVTASPTLIWNSDPTASSYSVYLNNSLLASGLTTTSYQTSGLTTGTYSWYVRATNPVGSTNGTAWSFTVGQYTPTATFFSQGPTLGASVFDFSISYSNPNYSAAKVDTSTFGNSNITVTGPNGYSQNASFISQSQPGDGNQRSATYEINAPSGAWNVLANGIYTITLNSNQVADEGGGYAAGGALGTFNVNEPFAYIASGSTQLTINSTSSNPSISMSKSASLWTISNGSSSDQFNSSAFSSVDFVGTSGNDTLSINSILNPVPLSFNGGSGSDTLKLFAGSLTLASDVSTTTAALTLDIFDNAAVNFTSNQHLAALNLSNDAAALLAGGDAIAVETGSLSINNDAYVDVADDALIVNAISASTVNSYLASDAIDSSTAISPGEAVGFAPGSAVSYSSIHGVSFSTTAIVMLTTADGDANLDGTINSDDLSLMALAAAQQQSAKQNQQSAPAEYWFNGDYNYDTKVNADDYLLLGLGSAVQNQQMLG